MIDKMGSKIYLKCLIEYSKDQSKVVYTWNRSSKIEFLSSISYGNGDKISETRSELDGGTSVMYIHCIHNFDKFLNKLENHSKKSLIKFLRDQKLKSILE